VPVTLKRLKATYGTSVADPGSGAFLPPESGIRIRDPVLFYPMNPGSGSGMNFSGSRIRPLFWGKFSYLFFRILVMLAVAL
jgi:hypothetical protein